MKILIDCTIAKPVKHQAHAGLVLAADDAWLVEHRPLQPC